MSGTTYEYAATLKMLAEEETVMDEALAKLMEERLRLQRLHTPVRDQKLSPHTLKHYNYILPLVKEIYLLELKIKEQQKAFDEKQWKCKAAAFGQDLLAATLAEDECVLKRWSKELSSASGEGKAVTNRNYKAEHKDSCLRESLSFTVLSQGVHVSLQIHSETPCQSIRFLRPSAIRLGFKSDTFIPGLEEKVRSSLIEGGSVGDIVFMVSTYIQEDMAPYVIIIPTKKKGKSKKAKLKQHDLQSKSETLSVSSDARCETKQKEIPVNNT